jgi:Uncharacterized domain/protein associated with RNAses G and E
VIDIEPGTPATLRWRKWDGSPHWVEPCTYLGADAAGHWFGQHAGAVSTRPGRTFTSTVASVALVPALRADGDWVANFHAPGHHDRQQVYIDLAHDVRWSARSGELTAIDMDLDVIRTADERGTWIDDIDEFAEHRALYGYPDVVARAVEAAAARLAEVVRSGMPPFDGHAEHWLAELAAWER